MNMPDDPFMLLSFINMKLRDDGYEDLADLCHEFGCEENDIIAKLNAAGFDYISEMKQFK